MSNLSNEIRSWYKNGTIVTQLILINAAVFIFFAIVNIFGGLTQIGLSGIEWWFAAPSNFTELIYKPWSVFTYMFVHDGIWHVAGNMIFLNLFGKIFLTFFSRKQFLSIYFLSGLVGYAVFAISYNIFPGLNSAEAQIVGASAAVMGIIAATITYAPNYEIKLMFIPFGIKILWIGIIFFIKDINTLKDGVNAGGMISHFGGLGFGYLAITQLQKGNDITKWFNNLLNSLLSTFKPKSKLKVKYKNTNKTSRNRPKTDEEYNAEKKDRQSTIDAILDKIKRSGYESLSKAEKDYLFNEGKKL